MVCTPISTRRISPSSSPRWERYSRRRQRGLSPRYLQHKRSMKRLRLLASRDKGMRRNSDSDGGDGRGRGIMSAMARTHPRDGQVRRQRVCGLAEGCGEGSRSCRCRGWEQPQHRYGRRPPPAAQTVVSFSRVRQPRATPVGHRQPRARSQRCLVQRSRTECLAQRLSGRRLPLGCLTEVSATTIRPHESSCSERRREPGLALRDSWFARTKQQSACGARRCVGPIPDANQRSGRRSARQAEVKVEAPGHLLGRHGTGHE